METTMTAITGKEAQGDLSTPYQTLVQFYYAFTEGHFETMSANWLQTDEIAMDNPLGGIKRGWDEIRTVLEQYQSAVLGKR
jgi:hypothetical protein